MDPLGSVLTSLRWIVGTPWVLWAFLAATVAACVAEGVLAGRPYNPERTWWEVATLLIAGIGKVAAVVAVLALLGSPRDFHTVLDQHFGMLAAFIASAAVLLGLNRRRARIRRSSEKGTHLSG